MLESAIYKEAYRQVADNIVNLMSKQSTTPEQGEDLRKLLIAMGRIKTYIEQVAATGTMAAMEEERKRTFLEKQAERFLRRA